MRNNPCPHEAGLTILTRPANYCSYAQTQDACHILLGLCTWKRLAASRVANVALRELGVVVLLLILVVVVVVVLLLLLLLLLLLKTKPLGLGSFIYRIRISLNTKHLYTSSHRRCLLRASIMNF